MFSSLSLAIASITFDRDMDVNMHSTIDILFHYLAVLFAKDMTDLSVDESLTPSNKSGYAFQFYLDALCWFQLAALLAIVT